MPLSIEEAQSLANSAVASLHRGDAAAARVAFARVVAEGAADASVHLGLAYACQALGEVAQAHAAVDAALAGEPRNIRGLMLKAELAEDRGDDISAASFYRAVLKCAEPPTPQPPDLAPLVARAQARTNHYAERFEATLREQLAAEAARSGPPSPRFTQSLDLLTGQKQLYLPAPRLYRFPELPAVQFPERAAFPWLDKLEAATADIRRELLALMDDRSAFAPYVQSDARRASIKKGGMLDNPAWSACYLWKNGQRVEANMARCPRTLEALADVPIVHIPGRSPSVLFSLLRPDTRIPPHHGYVNTRYIVHLPLIVPPGCAFRVGNETREWVEGKAWLFDDTIEHEAWNTSGLTRVILLFEVWRPEFTATERAHVSALFQAIERQSGGVGEWSI